MKTGGLPGRNDKLQEEMNDKVSKKKPKKTKANKQTKNKNDEGV